jgi:hypothetical protein
MLELTLSVRLRKGVGRFACRSFPLVALFSLLAFVAQPELDDRAPFDKARVVAAKLITQENQLRRDYTNQLKASLAVGNAVFTPGFYRHFVRLDRKQELTLWPIISNRPVRSPPHFTV